MAIVTVWIHLHYRLSKKDNCQNSGYLLDSLGDVGRNSDFSVIAYLGYIFVSDVKIISILIWS